MYIVLAMFLLLHALMVAGVCVRRDCRLAVAVYPKPSAGEAWHSRQCCHHLRPLADSS